MGELLCIARIHRALADLVSSLFNTTPFLSTYITRTCTTCYTSFKLRPRRLTPPPSVFGYPPSPASFLLYLLYPTPSSLTHPAPIRRRSHEHEHQQSSFSKRMGFERMHSEGMESEMSESDPESGSPERSQAGPSKRKSTSNCMTEQETG
jgi:hypothetical protein